MKIVCFISDYVSLRLNDFRNYKKNWIRDILMLSFSFITADYINQTKNDFITFVIAFLIIVFMDAIFVKRRKKKH